MLDELKAMQPHERAEFLNNHATLIEEGEYFKSFGAEDLQESQADLAEALVKLERKEKELAEIKATYKLEIDKLKKPFKEALNNIVQQGEWLTGKQFLFDDQETGMMNYYDGNGQLIRSRRLKPEERQMNILSLNKTAHS